MHTSLSILNKIDLKMASLREIGCFVPAMQLNNLITIYILIVLKCRISRASLALGR